jgi:hypothetical protein
MPTRPLLLASVCLAVLSGCNWMTAEYWELVKTGYRLSPNCFWSQGKPVHCLEVSMKQLDRLGGSADAVEFEKYATGLLKERNLCPNGWKRAAVFGTGRSMQVNLQCS